MSRPKELLQSLIELSSIIACLDVGLAVGRPIEASRRRCAKWQDRLRSPNLLYIVVKGDKRAGKSTLLNALLGGDYLPATDEPECTAIPISIRKASAFRLDMLGSGMIRTRVTEFLPEDSECIDIAGGLSIVRRGAAADPAWISSLIQRLATGTSPIEDLLQLDHELILQLPNVSLPDDIVLIDTPGTASIIAQREEISNLQFALASAVVLAVNWTPAPSPIFYQTVREALGNRGERSLLVVITKSDQAKTEQEKKGLYDVMTQVETKLRAEGLDKINFLSISAKNTRIGQKLKSGELTLQALNDTEEYYPFSKKETRALGSDEVRWIAALERSGNLSEVMRWLDAQRSKAITLDWIAQEAAIECRDIAYRVKATINMRTEDDRQQHRERIASLLEQSKESSKTYRSLNERKDKTVSSFKSSMQHLKDKLGPPVIAGTTKLYFSEASINEAINQPIISLSNSPAQRDKLKHKDTKDFEAEINKLVSEYANKQVKLIEEEYKSNTQKLRQEIEQLAQDARESLLPSSFNPKITAEDPEQSTKGRRIGSRLGAMFGWLGAVLIAPPLIIIWPLGILGGWFYDRNMDPSNDYAATAINNAAQALSKCKNIIHAQLAQNETHIVNQVNLYFTSQIDEIERQLQELDEQLNQPPATSQELTKLTDAHQKLLKLARILETSPS